MTSDGNREWAERPAELATARPLERAARPWEATEIRAHPEARLVPQMDERQYRDFRGDVAERGISDPLQVTAEGVLLDGRSRLRAARELGIAHLPVLVVAPPDEREHMLLRALRRSHLSPSQRIALAVELQVVQAERERAGRRQRANLRRGGEVATLPPRGERTRELAARIAGVSPRTAQDAFTVRQSDPELFELVRQGRLPVSKAARRIRQRERDARLASAAPALPEGPFELILADPPWQLEGNPESAWAPENHYPTMTLEELKTIELPAAEEALLFLWATGGTMPHALELMAAWRFEYRSQIVWVKPSPGIGQWVRYQHELLLIGRSGGHAAPEPELRPPSVIEAPRGRHSEKPECFYELIERMYPEASKLELSRAVSGRAGSPSATSWPRERTTARRQRGR